MQDFDRAAQGNEFIDPNDFPALGRPGNGQSIQGLTGQHNNSMAAILQNRGIHAHFNSNMQPGFHLQNEDFPALGAEMQSKGIYF